MNETSNTTLVSCYKNTNYFGFKLMNNNSVGYISNGGQNTKADTSQKKPREVFVLTHKQGENKVTIYSSALGELAPQKTVLTSLAPTATSDATLVLGAYKNNNGFFQEKAKGIVHRLELLDGILLGEQDCIELT